MVSLPSPTNWSRTCEVWIQEIRIAFEDPVETAIRGGFLRTIRRLTAALAGGVTLSFTLHCTRPPLVPAKPSAGNSPREGLSGDFVEEGIASWYGGNGDGFAGKPTASGELFDPQDLTAAHRTLPLGTLLHVENLENGREVTVRVNDRGPFVKGRFLDLSKRSAQLLGYAGQGTARVRIRAVDGKGRNIPIPQDRENPFVVQVAALSNARNIEALRKELQGAYAPVTLQNAIAQDGKEVKRVRVGSYHTREEAERAADQLAKQLKDRGVEPFITRRR